MFVLNISHLESKNDNNKIKLTYQHFTLFEKLALFCATATFMLWANAVAISVLSRQQLFFFLVVRWQLLIFVDNQI